MDSTDAKVAGLDSIVEARAREQKFVGCLLGGAVGDAVGLACENIGPRRIEKLFPDLDGPRLLGRRGMVSDDTEHALFTARALFGAGDDAGKFSLLLQRELKAWLLNLPAGAGAATLKAALRSWRGAAPEASGVASAGNGPAMRAPIIGLWAGHNDALLCELNRASSRLTHLDPRAEAGALCVAAAAHDAAQGLAVEESAERIHGLVRGWMRSANNSGAAVAGRVDEGVELLLRDVVRASVAAREGVECWEFARSIVGEGFEKKGVSGFISHTVPVALHAAWRHDDLRESVLNAVRCGGDTDSVASIAGAISGARLGAEAVPREWLSALFEWPRGESFMRQAAQTLAAARAGAPAEVQETGAEVEWPHASFAGVLARNAFFLAAVLAHGLRRLAPPY